MAFVSSLQGKSFTRSFAFEIPNFLVQAKLLLDDKLERLRSPYFEFEGLEKEKHKGCVYLQPTAGPDESAFDIIVSMHMEVNFPQDGQENSGSSPVTTRPQFTVAIKSGMEFSALTTTSAEPLLFRQNNTWHVFGQNSKEFEGSGMYDSVICFVTYAGLERFWKDENGGARIVLTMSFFYTSEEGYEWKEENSVPSFNPGKRKKRAERPALYIDQLTKRQKTDVTIECGGKEFSVHKLVLSCVSPVFDRMLSTAMVEKESDRVKIRDVAPQAVQLMLDFIYTGSLFRDEKTKNRVPDELLVQLLNCAEKYGIEALKDQVGLEICANLTVMNAIMFVDALKTYGADERVVGEVLEFCKKNLTAFPRDGQLKNFFLNYMENLL